MRMLNPSSRQVRSNGPARLTFHGVDTLRGSDSPADRFHYNLTFRAAR